jgi:hypothetical protein
MARNCMRNIKMMNARYGRLIWSSNEITNIQMVVAEEMARV